MSVTSHHCNQGVFFLGFIGYEYDKHDLGTDVPVAPAFRHATFPVGNEIKCFILRFIKRVISFCQQ